MSGIVQGWSCTQIFEGHSHYVMQACPESWLCRSSCEPAECCKRTHTRPVQVIFNPKDTNTFASASLDKTVKVLLESAASLCCRT